MIKNLGLGVRISWRIPYWTLKPRRQKKIPLCRTPQADTLTWPYNQNGDYALKSGYKVLQDEYQTLQPGSSTSDISKPLWQDIWNLNVPSKVKNLLWRACKNALPSKTNLVRRQVILDVLCEVCKTHHEDIIHALYLCPSLNDIWDQVPLWNHANLRHCSNFIELMGVYLCWKQRSLSICNGVLGIMESTKQSQVGEELLHTRPDSATSQNETPGVYNSSQSLSIWIRFSLVRRHCNYIAHSFAPFFY